MEEKKVKEEKEKKAIETIDVNELIEGNKIFESRGHSLLRVTYDGTKKNLRIPIKSSGVSELIDEFNKKAPQPPAEKCLVEPGTPMGNDLGIIKKQWVFLSNYADPDYVKAKEDHDSNLGIMIVMRGLDMDIKDKDGTVIEDTGRKVKALRAMGLSGNHFTQLVEDINSLTRFVEEKESDFLPG